MYTLYRHHKPILSQWIKELKSVHLNRKAFSTYPRCLFKASIRHLGLISLFLIQQHTLFSYSKDKYIDHPNWYVNDDAPGNNSGEDWRNAFQTIQRAIDVANEGDTIRIAEGQYQPTSPIRIWKNLTILGGFKDPISYSEGFIPIPPRDPTQYSTNINGVLLDQVLLLESLEATTIDGLTFSSWANISSTTGAVLLIRGGNPTISNCHFFNNQSLSNAIIELTKSSEALIINCSFHNNAAKSILSTGNLQLINSVFWEPTYTGNTIDIRESIDTDILNCTFFKTNPVDEFKGIIKNEQSNLELINSILWNPDGKQLLAKEGVDAYTYLSHCLVSGDSTNIVADSIVQVSNLYPEFIDPTAGNFNLSVRSPGFDAGENTLLIRPYLKFKDLNGNTRVVNSKIDIGAFEINRRRFFVSTKGNDEFPGDSWELAFRSLNQALAYAESGDIIWIAEGVYTPTADKYGDTTPYDERTKTFYMDKSLKIFGGFAGQEGQFHQRGSAGQTILNGALSENQDTNGFRKSVYTLCNLEALPPDSEVEFEGLDFQYGGDSTRLESDTLSPATLHGGAIFLGNGQLTTQNCRFSYNYGQNGGAIFVDTLASIFLLNTVFENNSAQTGGGIYFAGIISPLNNQGFRHQLQHSSFTANQAIYGGALQVGKGQLILFNACDFNTNTAEAVGGAIQVVGDVNLGFSFCNFKANSCQDAGGAISVKNSSPTGILSLFQSSFTSNQSHRKGGALSIEGAAQVAIKGSFFNSNHVDQGMAGAALLDQIEWLEITDTDFSENQTESLGGALVCSNIQELHFKQCKFTQSNSTIGGAAYLLAVNDAHFEHLLFEDNSSVIGGAFFCDKSSLQCTDSEFLHNESQEGGGAFFVRSSVELERVNFRGNTAMESGGAISCFNVERFMLLNSFILENSLIDGLEGTAITIAGANTANGPIELLNTTIYGNTGRPGNQIIYTDWTLSLNNSILWGNDGGLSDHIFPQHCIIKGGYHGEQLGVWDVDPLFTNPQEGDFSLQPCSRAINTGNNFPIYLYRNRGDFASQTRLNEAVVDIGALEYQAPLNESQSIHYVDASIGSDNNRGKSWACPVVSPQLAIDEASEQDSVFIAVGNYYPSFQTDLEDERSKTFFINKHIRLFGGFRDSLQNGAYVQMPLSFDPKPENATIFNGDIGIKNEIQDNSYHVMTLEGLNTSAVLDRLAIVGGFANGIKNKDSKAGGLYVHESDALIQNCMFQYNQADSVGGALFVSRGSFPTLKNCIFEANSSEEFGGAIFNKGNLDILNAVLFENRSKAGGAIFVDEEGITDIVHATITKNAAEGFLGIIQMHDDATTNIYNSIIWNNRGTSLRIEAKNKVQTDWSIIQDGCNSKGIQACNAKNFVWSISPSFNSSLVDDFALQSESPAINAADLNTSKLFNLTTDLFGRSRVANGSKVDLGAIEFCANSSCPLVTSIEDSPAVSARPEAIQVWPNPTFGMLQITKNGKPINGKGSILVSDLTGRTISVLPLQPKVDLSGLEKGMYILRIQDRATLVSKRVFIQ